MEALSIKLKIGYHSVLLRRYLTQNQTILESIYKEKWGYILGFPMEIVKAADKLRSDSENSSYLGRIIASFRLEIEEYASADDVSITDHTFAISSLLEKIEAAIGVY
jgi:adenine-specific DNA methylase